MSVTGWDGVTLTVEVALSADTSVYGLWDAAIWDTSTWGPDTVWTDVTADVRHVTCSRGFSRGVNAWGGGNVSITLDNQSGDYDPANPSGPYVTAGVTQIRPLRPVQVRATYGGVQYPIWRGYVMEWAQGWARTATGQGDAITTLRCQDEWARLAGVDGVETPAVGAGELSGARIHRVLDDAGHTGERTVETGEVTLQATTLAGGTLTDLDKAVQAEGGAAYVSRSGAVVAEGRYALINNSRSVTSQGTFSDSGSDIRYADLEQAYDANLVMNYAAYTRTGGTPQLVDDPTSRALYGDRRETIADLIAETDTQALTLAQWRVQQYKDPELRFTRMRLIPRRDPAVVWPQALGREVRDMITINRQPPGGHSISRACHIAGISHDITPAQWTTTFELWSAQLYVTYASSRWDTGLWGASDADDSAARWFF